MNSTTTRRIVSLGLVSAAATFALAAPATAGPIPPDPIPQHYGQGIDPTSTNDTSSNTVSASGTEWAQVGYGAAGGVALFAAGAAGVVMLRRRQHLPHHA